MVVLYIDTRPENFKPNYEIELEDLFELFTFSSFVFEQYG